MPAYATQADMEANIEGWVTDNPAALDRYLERASRDLDLLFPHLWPYTSGTYAGFKLDPTTMLAYEREALARATCYQAEYRIIIGEEDLAGDSRGTVLEESGPDFRVRYADANPRRPGTGRYSPKLDEPFALLERFRVRSARLGGVRILPASV